MGIEGGVIISHSHGGWRDNEPIHTEGERETRGEAETSGMRQQTAQICGSKFTKVELHAKASSPRANPLITEVPLKLIDFTVKFCLFKRWCDQAVTLDYT